MGAKAYTKWYNGEELKVNEWAAGQPSDIVKDCVAFK
jgi:hypothetical protein